MASYLPVLLVSVSTNSNDDSAVTTLPRGQVDYLSHEWQEEDVWRSWRNMTRQKNEIANGMRLENASWRTWWKQRNKLKTISPETLNWLKDSDVTWLYGPLHTAVEWTPPPRRSTVVPNDHLDLSQPKHKPILKHRNLSDFLTSDLPHSPVFSPPESDSENDDDDDDEGGSATADVAVSLGPHRPALPQTKSDTHLTRLVKPNRAFRKDSPPRVEPPNLGLKNSHAYSGTDLNGYFQAALQAPHSSTPSPSGTDATPTAHPINGHARKKSKHITFNTFVEQCISIDKPKSRSTSKVRSGTSGWDGRTGTKGVNWDVNYQDVDEDEIEDQGDERGYDEDVESSDDGDWKRSTDADNEFAICTDSEDSDVDLPPSYPVHNDSDEDDDGIIHMRSHHRSSTSSAPRSHSKSSTSSASTSSSTSESGPRKRPYATAKRRQSSASTLRPNISKKSSHSSSSSSSSSTSSLAHLASAPSVTTIAPIAPTMLKVGGNAWDGFGVQPNTHRSQWLDSFGDESWSDDGYAHFGDKSVELVYVPKVQNDAEEEEETFHHRGAYFSIGEPDTDMDLGFGEDYFGRSQPDRSNTRTHRQTLNHGGEEERMETVDPPSKSESPTPTASPEEERPPVSTAPVNIPKSIPRTISPPQATSVPTSSSASSLLSPPSRGRSSEPVSNDSPRGRSLTRTASWTSDRERSRSMGTSTSPMGSLSPDGGGISIVAGGVYANGRNTDRDLKERTRRRREATGGGSSVSPEAESVKAEDTPKPLDTSNNTQVLRETVVTAPSTPFNSPEQSLAMRSAPSVAVKPPQAVVGSQPIVVRTSGEFAPSTRSHGHHARRVSSSSSSGSPTESEGSTIMGRMVTSAGSYFGLWH